LPESVTEKLVTNAGENGKSTGERECWSLIMYNVNIPMGCEKTKSNMRLAVKCYS